MTDDARSAPVPTTRQEERRVSLLELFFDLVFVVALANISGSLSRELNPLGALHSAVMLMALWWVWSITALACNMYDGLRPQIRALIITVMLASMLLAINIPTAFVNPRHGLIFAASYVAIHLSRPAFLAPLVRGQPEMQHRAQRILFWFVLSAVPWIAGGLVDGDARLGCWLLALAIDYGAFWAAYPIPRLGRVPLGQRHVMAHHLAERYQQFFIIALGDAILVGGLGLTASTHAPRSPTLVVFFLHTLLLWRVYSHKAGELLPEAIAASVQPKHFVKSGPYIHLLLVAGAMVTAAGFKLVIADPYGDTKASWLWLILGGPALFLVGRASFEHQVFNRVSWSRPGGVVALGLAAPIALHVPPLGATAAATVVLAGVAFADARRSWHKPPEHPAPPR
ncbi:low temperature requirement protein A [Micromonospora sp. NPDC049559]|uniref:low temperature requirement protein A n=1 Tax=Micromonospora sp. NPDC049559 TaxID=3155923 RepID=UPI00342B8DFF